jgi:hypothetical protein
MLGARYVFRIWVAVALFTLLAAAAAHAVPSKDLTVEEMKGKLASMSVGDRPHLCVQIAQKQLAEADKQYAASEFEKGQAALVDVVAYSELARDYALQSRKYQKQSEIAVRTMARKLTELMHSLSQDDQVPVQDAIKHLQRVRDDLLMAMFPKGAK